MTGCKETACTRCVHREVCKYKYQLLELQTGLDKVDWLFPVDLSCRYHHQEAIDGCEVILKES